MGTFWSRRLQLPLPGYLIPLGVALAAGQAASQLSIPLFIAAIVDDALIAGNADQLTRLCLGLVVVAVVLNACRIAQELLYRHAALRSMDELQLKVGGHLLSTRLSYLDSTRTGGLYSHVAEDAPQAVQRIEPIARTAIQNGVLLLGLLVLLGWKYGLLALVAVMLIPLYVVFPLLLGNRLRRASKALLEARTEANALFQETFQAVRDLKILGRESWAVDRLRPFLEHRLGRFMRYTGLSSLQSISSLFYFLVAAIVYRVGGGRVLAGEMTVGGLVALVSLLGMLESPVSQIARLNGPWQSSRAALERISEILSRAVEPATDAPSASAHLDAGTVEFERVTFHYDDRDPPAVEDVSFTAEPGSKVALVGPSGAGKTTLVHLLLRLYEPSEGRITIAGRDIRQVPLATLRREVGLVQQDPLLLSGSLRDNLRVGRLDATDEETEEAARIANADEFIRALPEGYETRVGERGVGLSGGQRQRIAIARIVLRNPRILVLDEATSSLDAESEHAVREALERTMEGRTTLVVAHRLSTVVDADRIVVLEEGRLVAQGRHERLLESCSLYHRLCELQWGSTLGTKASA